MKPVLLKSKVQTIFYEDEFGHILKQYENTLIKRLSRSESEEVLKNRNIPFKDIIKVQYENMYVAIPFQQLDQYIIETTSLREHPTKLNL